MRTIKRKAKSAYKKSYKKVVQRKKRAKNFLNVFFTTVEKTLKTQFKSFQRKPWDHLRQSTVWMVPSLILVAVLFVTVKPRIQFPVTTTSVEVHQYFEKSNRLPALEDRIDYWSDKLLRMPKLLSSFHPGPKVQDTAPIFPRDYDCTTYVETVAGLARSRTEKELADQIIAIRYKNKQISFETRNHFPEADWIPNNEASQILKDITVDVAQSVQIQAGLATKEIDRDSWLAEHGSIASRLPADESKSTVPVELPYIPLDKIEEALPGVPHGAIINIVRVNNPIQPVLITHQGFLLWKIAPNGHKTAYIRHSSKSHRISEVKAIDYFRKAYDLKWKVLGVNVNQLQDSI